MEHDGYNAFAASCFNLGPEHTSEIISNTLTDVIGNGHIYEHMFEERRRRSSLMGTDQARFF